jgi:peptide/nickel transport system substrate-binding protein
LLTGIPGDLSLAYVGALFDGRQAGGSLDYAGYHTAHLDALFERARGARSSAEARAVWLEIQEELAHEAPVAWVYHSRGVQGLTARLRNVRMDLRGEMPTIAQWELGDARAAVATR